MAMLAQDVQAIIEYIDYRNHSRYSEGEIESVLKRLTKEQKVVQRQGKYFSDSSNSFRTLPQRALNSFT
jgi:hypothetical protein